MIYNLPTSLTVGGTEYEIRTDFRDILDILEISNDTEINEQERYWLSLLFFYTDFQNMPEEDYREALEKCYWFINGGQNENPKNKNAPRLMDWEKDFPYIIAPINRVIGREIRADKHLHWWTFLSAYMEIGECTLAQIVHIRDCKRQGKKLTDFDKEWYRKNRDIVDLAPKYTAKDNELFEKLGGV